MGRTGERDVSTADVSVWPQHEGNGGDQCKRAVGSACEGPYRPATGHGLLSCAGCLSRGDFILSHAWWQCAGWGRRVTVQRKEGFPFVFGGISRSQSTERR